MVVEILCTINAINVKHVKEIAKMGNELGVPVNFNLFKPFAKKHDYLIVNPDDFFEAVENLLKMRVHEGYKIGISDASLSAYMMGLPEKNECTATMSGIVINTDGKMLTCRTCLKLDIIPKMICLILIRISWKNGSMVKCLQNLGSMGRKHAKQEHSSIPRM